MAEDSEKLGSNQTAENKSSSAMDSVSMLKRAFAFLYEGDWANARQCCDMVLRQDSKIAQAHLGRLMAELHVKKMVELADCKQPFDKNDNYRKLMRYADPKLIETLKNYTEKIKARIEAEKKAREEQLRAEKALARRKTINKILTISGIVCGCVIAIVIFWYTLGIQLKDYYNAVSLKRNSYYEDAIKAFSALNGFMDSELQIVECKNFIKYDKALNLFDSNRYEEALEIFEELGDFRDSKERLNAVKDSIYEIVSSMIGEGNSIEAFYMLSLLNNHKDSEEIKKKMLQEIQTVGNIVAFGNYGKVKENSDNCEKILWKVLAQNGDNVLLVMNEAIDCKPYNKERKDVTWDSCTLRKWLNEEFLNTSFKKNHKKIMQITHLEPESEPYYDTDSGTATDDSIFLLDKAEAEKYFHSDEERKYKVTDFAKSSGVTDETVVWWLRSAGRNNEMASCVNANGVIGDLGNPVNFGNIFIRPAMWISLK